MSYEYLIEAMNLVREQASAEYQTRVPVATATNINDVAFPILEYAVLKNEFVNAFINKIGFTKVRRKMLHNPLEVLKQGRNLPLGVNAPLGDTVEEIFTNPAKAKAYNARSTDLLEQTPPDIKVAYHRLNRKDRYDITISTAELRKAFNSWGALNELLENKVNALYSGNYYDEFMLCKQLLGEAVTDSKILTETVNAVTDEASAKAFIASARNRATLFGIPSSSNNPYKIAGGTGNPIVTWTPPEDIRFIIRSDVNAICDVEALAKAFNLDKASFLGQTLIVDDFGASENTLAIMCDKSYTQIYDDLLELAEFKNGSNLTHNYYLHVWQTYSVSLFCNAVAFNIATS